MPISQITSASIAANTITSDDMSSTAQYYGFKNRIINGAMVIDQRNAGASVTPSNSYTLDRWSTNTSQASKFTVQQSTTAPVGFINSLKVTSSSAYTVGAGDVFTLYQAIEGLNCSDLAWGTANAKTITLSFQVYSSLTGTFGGALTNSANDRSYPFSYSIPVANTWTTISITIAGDTTGTWLTTNGSGIIVRFGLGVGSTYSNTAGAWSASNYYSSTGATSVVGTNGATFYITGVQLEKGSVATSFDYRPYGTELMLCQRYCYAGDSWQFNAGMCGATNNVWLLTRFPVIMRTGPSVSISSGSIIISDDFAADFTISSPVASTLGSSEHGGRVLVGGASGLTVQRFYSGIGGTAKIIWSAEL